MYVHYMANMYITGGLLCTWGHHHCLYVHTRMLAVGPNKLLFAAGIGDCQEIQRLIDEEGLSPSHVYPRGVTALHESCEAIQVEAANLLIENGADVNKQVYYLSPHDIIESLLYCFFPLQTHAAMVTPLHLASQSNSIEIARLLISAGAKLDLKDIDGKVHMKS